MKSARFPFTHATWALCLALGALSAHDGHARAIHESSAAAIAHRDGRAGVLTGSTAVEAPDAWRAGGDPVVVTFDPGFSERTNMPREARQEPPVADRTQPASMASHG